MYNLKRIIILLFCTAISSGHLNSKLLTNPKHDESLYFYTKLLMEIKTQKPYDSILMVQHRMPQDPRLQMIYTLKEPKVIITKKMHNKSNIYYKEQFNNEVIAVMIIERYFTIDLWEHFLHGLDYLRQIRILMIFVNVRNTKKLQDKVIKVCEEYDITNGILHFLNSSNLRKTSVDYLQLLPYPQYHLKTRQFGRVNEEYFPIHWRDMKGKTLMTIPDQLVPRSIMYRDEKGKLRYSGLATKMVELFAEVYNATLKMPFQPKIGEIIHYSTILNMTKNGLLDMPMSVNPIFTARSLRHMSYPTEVSKWMIMIPCSTRMNICEVYELMLNPQLFGVIIVFTIIFSLLHTIIEKLFYKQMIWLNLIMCDKVIPGVLGQSFNLKKSSVLSLRMIYVLIFILGLYMSTHFSAHLQTLITSPPFHSQISTFKELRESEQKILLNKLDLIDIEESDDIVSNEMKDNIVYTDNSTYFEELRDSFNSTYGYTLSSALWNVYSHVQMYYAEKKFCVSESMNMWNVLLFGLPLGKHSPYKEPLDYLVHKIHSSGLIHAWQLEVFNDLLSSNRITFRDPSRLKTYEDLTESDLLLIWIILVIGLTCSVLVFFSEIVVDCCVKKYLKKK
ncbi:hypothetical protein CVS40_2728 [Lucilia cuprina]|nr:hypothetical protein CVS40_2728 [Lucilia cuprina]